jgi:hypothetical protein
MPPVAGELLFRQPQAQFGSCHENVTQIAENGGKSAANDNK